MVKGSSKVSLTLNFDLTVNPNPKIREFDFWNSTFHNSQPYGRQHFTVDLTAVNLSSGTTKRWSVTEKLEALLFIVNLEEMLYGAYNKLYLPPLLDFLLVIM